MFQGQDRVLAWIITLGGVIGLPYFINRILRKAVDSRRTYIYLGIVYGLNYKCVNQVVEHLYYILTKR